MLSFLPYTAPHYAAMRRQLCRLRTSGAMSMTVLGSCSALRFIHAGVAAPMANWKCRHCGISNQRQSDTCYSCQMQNPLRQSEKVTPLQPSSGPQQQIQKQMLSIRHPPMEPPKKQCSSSNNYVNSNSSATKSKTSELQNQVDKGAPKHTSISMYAPATLDGVVVPPPPLHMRPVGQRGVCVPAETAHLLEPRQGVTKSEWNNQRRAKFRARARAIK